MHDGYAYFTTDDGKFYIDALVDGILKRTLINPTDDATGKVKSATTAEWAQQTSLTSEKDVIYVYTDHQTDNGKNIPGIKIGDGLTYVVDLPFVDTIYMKHITDTDIHITAEERAKWNKVNSAVPNTRTVNGKALSSDISLGAGDVGAYTKSETDTKINAAVASAYKYKGSVTVDKLPTSGQVVGDVYNITNDSSYGKAGMNVAWNGTTWDALGSNVDLSNYVTTSDSRLSNARPASDVYAWAKAAKKPSYSASEIGAAPASHTHTKDQVGLGNVDNTADNAKSVKYAASAGNANTATGHSLGLNIPSPSADDQDKYLSAKGTWESITGKISGTKVTSANSADKLTTARTLTIGNKAKSFDGSANVSWSLNEIGAVNKSGDTMTGALNFANNTPNVVGDDVQIGDFNLNGSLGIQGLHGQTSISLIKQDATWTKTTDCGRISYDGSNIIFNKTIIGNITGSAGSAGTVNGHTVNSDVPSGAKFTDTNTWRGITDSYSGTDSGTSLSQKGGNALYNALVNGYASSAGSASSATNANRISSNAQNIVYGDSHLQYNYVNGNVGNDPKAVQNPTEDWYYHIIMNHANSGGYYGDIALCFHSNDLRYRRVTNGSDNGWVKVIDSANIGSQSVNYANSAGSVAWSNVSGRPTSLPANGGNAATVNGHSVNADVPSGAKFTDTTYGAATQSSPGLMSAADKTKLDNLSSASTEGKEGVELTIPVSGWSSNTTAVNGTNYYTYSTTSITGISNPHPTIICSSASGVLPSAEERMAFDNIYFVTVDTSSSKITFYAPTKPKSTVVLILLKAHLLHQQT